MSASKMTIYGFRTQVFCVGQLNYSSANAKRYIAKLHSSSQYNVFSSAKIFSAMT